MMVEDPTRLAQFKVVYHHEPQPASKDPTSIDASHKFIVASSSKRAISTKKVKSSKQKKSKASNGHKHGVVDHPLLRTLYQKLPTGGQVQSYSSQERSTVQQQSQYGNLAAQTEAGRALRMAMQR